MGWRKTLEDNPATYVLYLQIDDSRYWLGTIIVVCPVVYLLFSKRIHFPCWAIRRHCDCHCCTGQNILYICVKCIYHNEGTSSILTNHEVNMWNMFLAHFLGVFPINRSDVSCDASCFTLPVDLRSSYSTDMKLLETGQDPFSTHCIGQRQLGSNLARGSNMVYKPRTMTKDPS